MNTVVLMQFGSHLYGTSTPESDTDYKGIFLPSREEVLLGNISRTRNESSKKDNGRKNTSEDVDQEWYSLHYFFKQASEGQTYAMDMLHAPKSMLVVTSEVWGEIVKNRTLFYSRNMSAFVGYARKQAAKYGIKGSRLNTVISLTDHLNLRFGGMKLKEVWDELPFHLEHIEEIKNSPNGIRQFQVCGKIMQETQSVGYTRDILEKFIREYGTRAVEASKNKNVDWKAISHAIRAAYQVKEILTKGTIVFPLKNASYLKDVKMGKLDYVSEVAPHLEGLMDEVEDLSMRSDLPKNVDQGKINRLLINLVEEYVL